MPDDSNGNHSLPVGYLAVTGQKVLPSNHNPPLEDISTALTARFSRDGRAPLTGNVNANSNKIYALANGVDPGDSVNKSQLDDNAAKYLVKTGNYTALNADYETAIRFTSAATLAFDVTANLRTNWRIEVWNDSSGFVTIDPNSTDTINGVATLVLQPGQRGEFFKTGSTTFQAALYGDQLSGSQLQGAICGLILSNDTTDATNDIGIAAGMAASDTSPFNAIQLGSSLIKRTDAAWAVGTNQGGWLDGASMPNGTGHVFLIQRSDTGVVDVGLSASLTPTLPTNYDRKRRIGSVIRKSGALVSFVQRGDTFMLGEAAHDISSSVGGTVSSVSITVPNGVPVMAMITGHVTSANASTYHNVDSSLVPSVTASSTHYMMFLAPANGYVSSSPQILTDNGSVRISSNATSSWLFHTLGWLDERGRNA